MPEELGLPRYLEKDTPEGTKVVTAGEYSGYTVDAKYNSKQHNFFEIGGDHVILNGGALNWREEQGQLVRGQVYDITYEGKSAIEKGKWAGNEAKQYKIAVYSKKEVTDLLEGSGVDLRGAIPSDEGAEDMGPVAELPSADASESLAGLE